jgi:SAM-dependent methyltransferase
MTREILLIGAGNSRDKKILTRGDPEWGGTLVTIDMDPTCGASLVWDMEMRPLPYHDERFDEIHAYDCLEHWGRQGDWRGWFDEMGEYHRLLKPGGLFAAVVPYGEDRYADPGHTRFFSGNHFTFLDHSWYDAQLRAGKPVTDYRWYWKKNFRLVDMVPAGDPIHHFGVVMEKK